MDASTLQQLVVEQFGVEAPASLVSFWRVMGTGYFGNRLVYFFGDGKNAEPRDSLLEWNRKDFWRVLFPAPNDGGSLFFAETCFGDQIGFRWENGGVRFVLFLVDTMESFILAENEADFFEKILPDRSALVDCERLLQVKEALGPLPNGMHYAPIISPLLGGQGAVGNFCTETPNVHLRTAIHVFQTNEVPRVVT